METTAKPKVGFKDHELTQEFANQTMFQLECLEIGVTSKCNMRCDYCTAWDFNSATSMSAEQAIEVIDSLPTLKRIKLSGGEVLLHYQTCLDIVKYCSSKGIATQINSNATVLTENRIKELDAAGLNFFHFSLNFDNAAEHAAYYRVNEKNFAKILKNISYAAQHSNIEVIVESIIFDKTQKHMGRLVKFIRDLGVTTMEVQNGVEQEHKCWDDLSTEEAIRNSVREIVANRPEDMDVYFSCLNLCSSSDFYKEMAPHIDNGIYFPKCIEGSKQLHIHSNGDVLICELGLPKVIANVFKGDKLVDIHKNMHPELKKFLDTHVCACSVAI